MVIEAVTAVAKAIAEALGLVRHRSDLRNAPDVREAAKAQSEADEVAKDIKAVAEGDLEEMRRRASE